jgi:hypothetical protein
MAYTHFRFGAALAILLLGSTALVGPAQAGWLFGESNKDAKAETGTQSVKAGTDVKPAETLDGSIRQAQLLRVPLSPDRRRVKHNGTLGAIRASLLPPCHMGSAKPWSTRPNLPQSNNCDGDFSPDRRYKRCIGFGD